MRCDSYEWYDVGVAQLFVYTELGHEVLDESFGVASGAAVLVRAGGRARSCGWRKRESPFTPLRGGRNDVRSIAKNSDSRSTLTDCY